MFYRPIIIFILITCTSHSLANDLVTGQESLEFHGYFRGGIGLSESGTTQTKFQAPGARAAYRLGNEPDTNLELQFNYNYELKHSDSKKDHIQGIFMIDGYKPHGESSDFLVGNLAQAYLSFNDILESKQKYWFGRRYYDRKDIHIMDHTWLNPGQGANAGVGVEDIIAGYGKLNIALFRYEDNFEITSTPHLVNSTNIDFRWHELSLDKNFNLTLWSAFTTRHKLDALGYKEKTGFGLGGWLDFKTSKTKNTTALLYQTGPSITQGDYNARPIREDLGWNLDEASTIELSNTTTYQSLPDYSVQWTVVYRQEDHGIPGDSKFSWISTGARPVLYFSKHVNLAFEIGVDNIDDEVNSLSGSLTKLTAALQLSANKGLFSRPVVRFFVTFADWSNELKGLVGNTPSDAPYANDTQGWTIGAQAEVWW